MDESLIEQIVPELREALVGLSFRQLFQLAEREFVLAFEGEDFRLLFVGVDAKGPRVYLVKRRLRELKKNKRNPSKFAVDLEKTLSGARLEDLRKFPNERVIELRFQTVCQDTFLIIQLTGKSSNLFLLNADRTIAAAAHKPQNGEQSIGMIYSVPKRSQVAVGRKEETVVDGGETPLTLSEVLDKHFKHRDEREGFDLLAATARKKNRSGAAKLHKLIANLEDDLITHGNAEKWKRYGDLLLANQSNATRNDRVVIVPDLFDETSPLIEIEVDTNDSLTEAAKKYFRRFTKAKNASVEIASRIETVTAQIVVVEKAGSEIEDAIRAGDLEFLKTFVGKGPSQKTGDRKLPGLRLPTGLRSFLSSDGFTILVGKKASDNDVLTFKVAQSRDTWMHAADYPGSHVVIRNADRKEIPQRTLVEAAQLAAFFSQGKKQPKAAVHYTEKKFVNKPRGAAPGLVRLASFKTILVVPVFPGVSPA